MTLSGRHHGARKIGFLTKLNGRYLGSEEWNLSTDAATVTIVQHNPGFRKPLVWVFERQ